MAASMNTQLLMLKGLMADLPETDRKKIDEIKASIRKIVEDNGEMGFLALSVIGAELVSEKETK